MARAMQAPTCSGVRVRSIADCNVIFHAVTLGILPLISRRLTIEERRAIQSGCVFVWEERTPTIEAVGVCTDLLPCVQPTEAEGLAHVICSGWLGEVDRFETMGCESIGESEHSMLNRLLLSGSDTLFLLGFFALSRKAAGGKRPTCKSSDVCPCSFTTRPNAANDWHARMAAS